MLAFFVLLQANQGNRAQTLAGLNSYFGVIAAPQQADLPAEQLFEPGEALLSEAGQVKLIKAAHPLVDSKNIIRIQSLGLAPGEHRFDAWDLSAARLGAVARALVTAGMPAERIMIAGLAEQDSSIKIDKPGQTIRLLESQEAAN
jgi:hypothetical protein